MLEIPIFNVFSGLQDVIRLPEATLSKPKESAVQVDYASLIPEIPPIIEAPVMESKERLVKLARSGMRSHAHRLLKEQGGLCPLCSKPIDLTIKGEGVIDHDHDTGRIRGLLHRSCNAAEGKISNAAARWGAKSARYEDIIPYLENVVNYLKKPASTMVYPMHKTPDERRDARLLKAREQRAAVAAKRKLAQANRRIK